MPTERTYNIVRLRGNARGDYQEFDAVMEVDPLAYSDAIALCARLNRQRTETEVADEIEYILGERARLPLPR